MGVNFNNLINKWTSTETKLEWDIVGVTFVSLTRHFSKADYSDSNFFMAVLVWYMPYLFAVGMVKSHYKEAYFT